MTLCNAAKTRGRRRYLSLLAGESVWTLYAAHLASELVGFVAIRPDRQTQVGEIGLNAVDPLRQARRAYRKVGFNVGIPNVWMCHKL